MPWRLVDMRVWCDAVERNRCLVRYLICMMSAYHCNPFQIYKILKGCSTFYKSSVPSPVGCFRPQIKTCIHGKRPTNSEWTRFLDSCGFGRKLEDRLVWKMWLVGRHNSQLRNESGTRLVTMSLHRNSENVSVKLACKARIALSATSQGWADSSDIDKWPLCTMFIYSHWGKVPGGWGSCRFS